MCCVPPHTAFLITLSANCPPLRCSVFVFVACLYQSPLCGQPIWCGHPTRNENCRLKLFHSQNMWKHLDLFVFRISLTNKTKEIKVDKHQHKRFISGNMSALSPGVWPGRGPGSNWWLAPLSPYLSVFSAASSHRLTSPHCSVSRVLQTTQIHNISINLNDYISVTALNGGI